MLKNRHLLTMRLVVSGTNQSSIDRENLLRKTKKLLEELKNLRIAAQNRLKIDFDRNERMLYRLRNAKQKAAKRARKLVKNWKKSAQNKSGVLKINGNHVIKHDVVVKKWKVELKIEGNGESPRKVVRKAKETSGYWDFRWNFTKFAWKSDVLKRKQRFGLVIRLKSGKARKITYFSIKCVVFGVFRPLKCNF